MLLSVQHQKLDIITALQNYIKPRWRRIYSMSDKVKILYYVNQFFGQVGGEDKADMKPELKMGVVGPSRDLMQIWVMQVRLLLQ